MTVFSYFLAFKDQGTKKAARDWKTSGPLYPDKIGTCTPISSQDRPSLAVGTLSDREQNASEIFLSSRLELLFSARTVAQW